MKNTDQTKKIVVLEASEKIIPDLVLFREEQRFKNLMFEINGGVLYKSPDYIGLKIEMELEFKEWVKVVRYLPEHIKTKSIEASKELLKSFEKLEFNEDIKELYTNFHKRIKEFETGKSENNEIRFDINPEDINEYYEFLLNEEVITADYLTFATAIITANFKNIFSNSTKYKLMKFIYLVHDKIGENWYNLATKSIDKTKSQCSGIDMKGTAFKDSFKRRFDKKYLKTSK